MLILYKIIINILQNIIVPKLYAGNHTANANTTPIITAGTKIRIVDNIDLLYTLLTSATLVVFFNDWSKYTKNT